MFDKQVYIDRRNALKKNFKNGILLFPGNDESCLLYTSPSPRDRTRSRMPSSA